MNGENNELEKKQLAKAYGKYAEQFTPKPNYVKNCVFAFMSGGLICVMALFLKNVMIERGFGQEDAGIVVTMVLVATAQLLTGLGLFDTIAKYAGAGVIVPITGFANSMVAPAIEYKKEGVVLGVGAKLFSLAGPVLVSGITVATLIGIIYWILGM